MPGTAWRGIALTLMLSLVVVGCGGRGRSDNQSSPPAAGQSGGQAPSGSGAVTSQAPVTGDITVWTFPQGDKEKSLKAYKAAFEKANPGANLKILVIAEGDPYSQKIRTGLRAKNPPDVAILEDRAWMKSGEVVELTPYYPQWGVDVKDFSPGALGRATLEGDPSKGVFGIGDFLGGNVIFYNKKLFDAAKVPYPPVDKSLNVTEYVDICRKLAKPDPNPAKIVYGCSFPEWGPGIQARDVFGDDGHKAMGNMNSPEMVQAFNLGSALLRDKMAPTGTALEAASESDLFAQGRIAMTWSDFTEAAKYKENKIDFGLTPFFVIKQGDTFADTFTAPWGTFKNSKNKEGALAFLRFLATEAQKIRLQTSSDPPLSQKVAEQGGYGKDDPVKEQYLAVLKAAAKPQVFVPPGVDSWDPAEVMRKMTVEGKTDSKPLLDDIAAKAQKELDVAWPRWDKLGR